jgi:hypothetical protein
LIIGGCYRDFGCWGLLERGRKGRGGVAASDPQPGIPLVRRREALQRETQHPAATHLLRPLEPAQRFDVLVSRVSDVLNPKVDQA